MHRAEQLQKLFYELITAFGNKDFATFENYLCADCLFEWPYLPLADFPKTMTGSAAFIAASKEGMADSTPYGHVVDRYWELKDPDWLIAEYHTDAIHLPSGKRYANNYVGMLRFEGDRVAYWKEYVNPLPILEVYGHDFRNHSAEGADK